MLVIVIKTLFRSIARKLYWLYRLFRFNISKKGLKISFPFILEGNGKIKIKEFATIESGFALRCQSGSSLSIDKYFNGGESAKMTVENKSIVKIGSNFFIGPRSTVVISNNWTIADDVYLAQSVQISSREAGNFGILKIGTGCYIGDNCILDVSCDLTIGHKVAIGAFSVLYTHDHDVYNKTDTAWKGNLRKSEIVIEDGAWIGSGVIILPGVIIGKRSVVAAGAIVTKDVLTNTLVAGVPARLIKTIHKGQA